METWTPETIQAYYRDPDIEWLDPETFAVPDAVKGGPLPGAGHYVMPHCGRIECCRPDGPFQTIEAAREWARTQGDR